MGDIFGYSTTSAKPAMAFESSKSILTVQGSSTGFLIQNFTCNYNQDVSEIFELGSDAVYWVRGRPTGDGSVDRIMGAKGGFPGLFEGNAFNACSGGVQARITAGGGKCGGGGGTVSLTLDGLVVTRVGLSMAAPASSGVSGLLNENLAFKFSYMTAG